VREPREQERSGSIRFGRFFGADSSSIYEVYSLVGMALLLPCATKQAKERAQIHSAPPSIQTLPYRRDTKWHICLKWFTDKHATILFTNLAQMLALQYSHLDPTKTLLHITLYIKKN
jgi:hypothetical protein